ncbi:TIM barrel protein [Tsukamurella soli]
MFEPPRTAVATVCLSGPLGAKLEAVAAAGFDGYELFEPDLVASVLSPAEVARRSADLGLTIDLYQPFRDLDSAEPERFHASMRRLERKFDVMDQLGCDLVLVCSSPLPTASRDDAQLVDQLGAAAELAAARGKRIAYEALAWGTHVGRYRHAYELVARVDHPALGTCLDSFHVLSTGDDPDGIAAIPAEKFFFLQLADAPRLSMDVLQWSRHHRRFPGQGTFDLTRFARAVVASGYAGPWSLEVFNDVFREADTARTAREAQRSLRYLFDQVETQCDAAGPAPLDDIVSVRLAAGPAMAPALADLLHGLGFTLRAAQSGSGLQLYRHGPVAIVVDPTVGTVYTAPGVPAELPAVAQIGIRSSDPAAWLARSDALDISAVTVPIPLSGTGGGSAAAGVVAPAADGAGHEGYSVLRVDVTGATSVDLRHPDTAEAWERAFDLVPRESGGDAGVFIGVDHIGLAVPADSWDGVILLLRSMFAMSAHEGTDVPDAVGMLHTQALTRPTDTGGELRIVPAMIPGQAAGSGPLRRRGGVTHVAFGSADILAAADRLAAAGLHPLPVPDNYYDDVTARFDLPAARIDQLRSRSLLYDADESGGEFLHMFTHTVGSDLFFEVVQRIGGYDGYGDVNSAVRVGAQVAGFEVAPAVE